MNKIIPSSFRDPSGFLFLSEGNIYRQINLCYRDDYDFFITSGLCSELVKSGKLIFHDEVNYSLSISDQAYKVIKPRILPFISYPYEWSFSQLKDAALLTLEIQQKALAKGLSLKDASAYNVQFLDGKPIFIDTLSFERFEDGCPWVAYRQFCQHFLAPLALMSRTDIRLNQILKSFIDGLPLELASTLLPFSSKMSLTLGLHIHLHAKSQRKYANNDIRNVGAKKAFTRKSFYALLDSLLSGVERLTWNSGKTVWGDYYEANNNYGDEGITNKEMIVSEFLDEVLPKTVWDLGANTGRFSRIAAVKGAFVVAWDSDPGCVEINYKKTRLENEQNILPLVLDLANPSPGIGWDNTERMSFSERGPADLILALGLNHHLAISNNIPFRRIAASLSKLCKSLVIEFVPKDDSQVQKLLATRKDIYHDYTQAAFEMEFLRYFRLEKSVGIKGTKRILYLMESNYK